MLATSTSEGIIINDWPNYPKNLNALTWERPSQNKNLLPFISLVHPSQMCKHEKAEICDTVSLEVIKWFFCDNRTHGTMTRNECTAGFNNSMGSVEACFPHSVKTDWATATMESCKSSSHLSITQMTYCTIFIVHAWALHYISSKEHSFAHKSEKLVLNQRISQELLVESVVAGCIDASDLNPKVIPVFSITLRMNFHDVYSVQLTCT